MRRTRSSEKRQGIAATELAVCLPLILILIMGTIQACSMYYLKQNLSVAAYEGIRKCVEHNASATDVETVCEQILADRRVAGGSISISPRNFGSRDAGTWITVSVTAPCISNSPVGSWFFNSNSLTGDATMMKEF